MTGNPRWRPTPLILASFALHGAAILWGLCAPSQWAWALAVVALNQVVLTIAGLLPRCGWLGPNVTRLPDGDSRVALTIDDGPDPEVTPRVLALLDEHRVKATFFCIGERAARHAGLMREIVVRGHAIGNHTQRHSVAFAFSGFGAYRREIAAAQQTLRTLTGVTPRFFRAPAGIRSPLLDPVLHALGLPLVSWTQRGFDTRDGNANAVTQRLLKGLRAGAILLLHDGNAARTADGTPVILAVLPALFDAAAKQGFAFVTLDGALPAAR